MTLNDASSFFQGFYRPLRLPLWRPASTSHGASPRTAMFHCFNLFLFELQWFTDLVLHLALPSEPSNSPIMSCLMIERPASGLQGSTAFSNLKPPCDRHCALLLQTLMANIVLSTTLSYTDNQKSFCSPKPPHTPL